MIARLRLATVAVVLVAMTLALWPVQALAIRWNWRLARRLPHLWHRVAAPLAGIRVRVVGAPATARPLLIASNHQSWADIVVLGQVMELSFIAKREVAGWPGFGLLARLQRTVFVAREDRRGTARQADAIAERLLAGDAMVLFAEGTTSDGNAVLTFRTALFGAAQTALQRSGLDAMTVQPVAVAYLSANGVPLGRYGRPLAAWPGEVPLVPHLRRFLAEGAVDATVSFGAPVAVSRAIDRKTLARRCEVEARRMLAESLAGHAFCGEGTPARPEPERALASPPREADTDAMPKRSFQKGV